MENDIGHDLDRSECDARYPGAWKAWEEATGSEPMCASRADGALVAIDFNGGMYGWEDGSWHCSECGSEPGDPTTDPSFFCDQCMRVGG